MANEIQLSATLTLNKAGLTLTGNGSIAITQTGTASVGAVQSIGLTTEALAIGDITDVGYVFVKNMDATNYVQLSLATPVLTAAAFVTLLPGEFAVLPTRIELIYALANTAACDVQVVALSR